jgi:hypothetical protein
MKGAYTWSSRVYLCVLLSITTITTPYCARTTAFTIPQYERSVAFFKRHGEIPHNVGRRKGQSALHATDSANGDSGISSEEIQARMQAQLAKLQEKDQTSPRISPNVSIVIKQSESFEHVSLLLFRRRKPGEEGTSFIVSTCWWIDSMIGMMPQCSDAIGIFHVSSPQLNEEEHDKWNKSSKFYSGKVDMI